MLFIDPFNPRGERSSTWSMFFLTFSNGHQDALQRRTGGRNCSIPPITMALPSSPSRLPGSLDVFVLVGMRSLTNKCQTSNAPQKMMLRIKTSLQDRAKSLVVPVSIPRWAAVSRQCWLTLLELLELLGQQGWFSMEPFKTIDQLLPCWVGRWAHSRRVDITSCPRYTFPMATPCIFTRRIPFHSQIISLFSESTYPCESCFLAAKGRRKKDSKIVCGKQTHFAEIFFKHFQVNISRNTQN